MTEQSYLCLENYDKSGPLHSKRNEIIPKQPQGMIAGGSGSLTCELQLEDWACSTFQNEDGSRVWHTCCVIALKMFCSVTFPDTEVKADRPVAPLILLLTLPVGRCHISKSPVVWDLPSWPGTLMDDGKWPGKHFHQLPQYPWVDPICPPTFTAVLEKYQAAVSSWIEVDLFCFSSQTSRAGDRLPWG